MNFPKLEENILRFWKEKKIFEKSISQRKGKPFFSFYDGPPFATGKPHYGHILATTIKDAVLRYWTMKGYQVPRRVGWDCHGLPVETLIEKELGIKNKKEIEAYGVEKFNAACRVSVFRCVRDFQQTLQRVGRWADYEKSYATLDSDYTESVWWVFKQLVDLGLVYKDYRVSPYCPRCGTPLSNFEVSQGYKDVEDKSAYIKFKLKGEASAYFLAWTTTPWTLPGNVGLAVSPNAEYAKVKQGQEVYILAKERIGLLQGPYETLRSSIKGKELVGLRYEPLFRALVKAKPERIENAFQVLPADFVTLEDGTGIVHTAVMYGDDDFKLGKKYKLPMHHTVDESGRFTNDVEQWQGMPVKEAGGKIMEDLKDRGLLYKQESITHAYPFCWRCDTPLLYYAINSWHVSVTKIKKELVRNNKNIRWVPSHVKEGRFGEWLREVKDWAISRSRYWGAPIPLWECASCGQQKVIGSKKELLSQTFSTSTFYILRHGHSERQMTDIMASWPEKNPSPLTPEGRKQIAKVAKKLKSKKIDLIFSSDLLRARQTAEILGKELGLTPMFDERLREWDMGELNGKHVSEIGKVWAKPNETPLDHYLRRFVDSMPGGENYVDVQKRMYGFLKEIHEKYSNKHMLIISHERPLTLMEGTMRGYTRAQIVNYGQIQKKFIQPGELRKLPFTLLPYDEHMQFDLHRPYIDEVVFMCSKCGGWMKRIKEVFDCWFESGSMPYGQWHYPFQNKRLVEHTFPADFIAEGLDQTRGWFYTLHVLAAALTRKNIGLGMHRPAFKNVIVNGLVLDAQGKKLSKRLKNYPEVSAIFNSYGADALRYFLLSSTPIGEDYRFSEERVREVWRKVISTLWNSYAFFALYKKKNFARAKNFRASFLLDRWILSRLAQTTIEITRWMDKYELTRGARPLAVFIEDLSNWYIRRSRVRFQQPRKEKEREEASQTLYIVLMELTKLASPFIPFIAEHIYQELRGTRDQESVHLADWPAVVHKNVSDTLEKAMQAVKEVVAKGLAERAKAGIKVRQPLQKLKVKSEKLKIGQELLELLKDELNVKEVVFDKNLKSEVELDMRITPKLKEEGVIREITRAIQEMRKEAGYKPSQRIILCYSGAEELCTLIAKNAASLKKSVGAKTVEPKTAKKIRLDKEKEIKIEGKSLWLGIKKT